MQITKRCAVFVLAVSSLPGTELARGHSELQKLTASDAAAGDNFGVSASISGDWAVVGAQADDDAGESSGSAYVFRREETGWVENDKLTALDAAEGDRFGWSVSIDTTRVVAGAPWDNNTSGSAYVFRRDNNGTPSDPSDDSWSWEQKLTASDATQGDQFADAVSINGSRVLVGARNNDGAGANSGAAYVFRLDDNNTPSDPSDDFWVEEQKLTASDADADDRFGASVSMGTGRAVVGAPRADQPEFDSGVAYVFRLDDNDTPSDPTDDFWIEEAVLTAEEDVDVSDLFGESVSISGDRVIVGALKDDDAGASSGSAYVFLRGGTSWVREAEPTAPDGAAGDEFGVFVSISEDWAVVGAHWDDDACPSNPDCNSGSAYAFRYNGTTWVEEPLKLTASDAAAGDLFGFSVSVSGDGAIIGAWKDDHEAGADAGAGYVFSVIEGPIPTVSEWGLTVMALLLLTAGTLVYTRRWPTEGELSSC